MAKRNSHIITSFVPAVSFFVFLFNFYCVQSTFAQTRLDNSSTVGGYVHADQYQSSKTRNGKAIVLIDQNLDDWQVLADSILPGNIVEIIGAANSPLQQITSLLHLRSLNEPVIDSIHIISHGKSGMVLLGGQTIDIHSLQEHAELLSQWKQYVTPNANLLLYGCDVGQGSQGQEFVDHLNTVTNLNTFASINKTGNSVLGGDWILEYASTNLNQFTPVFDETITFKYQYALTAPADTDWTGVTDTTFVASGVGTDFVQATDVNSSGWDISVQGTGLGGGDAVAVKGFANDGDNGADGSVASGGSNGDAFVIGDESTDMQDFIQHIDVKSNNGSSFNLDSVRASAIFKQSGPTADLSLRALDSGGNPSGSPVTFSSISFTMDEYGWRQFNVSANTDFDGIYGFRISISANAAGIGIDDIDISTAANVAPTISNLDGDSVTFTEGGTAVSLDSGTTLSITDGDSADYNGGTLTVTVVANQDSTEDQLTFDTSGSVSLSGMTSGSNVSVSSTVIGTLGNTIAAGNTLTVNLNASANPTNTTTLLQAARYQNTDTVEPSTNTRTVRVTVNDGDGGTSSNNEITLTVIGVNDEPTFSATGINPTFQSSGSAVTLFNSASASTVESGQNFTGFTVTVTNVNDTGNEVLNADGINITLDNGQSGTTATNSLNYNVSKSGSTATVTFSGGTVSAANINTLINGITYENNSGTATVTSRVVSITSISDNGGTSNGGVDTKSLTGITSTIAINNAPVITEGNSIARTIDEDMSLSLTLNATDANNDTLTWSITSQGSKGTASASGTGISKSISYAPNSNQNGNDSFTVQVSDGNGGTATIVVNVTITPVNDAPVANNQSVNVDERSSVVVTLTGSDVDSSSLTFTLSGNPSNGTLTEFNASARTVRYTPNVPFTGSDSFIFSVSDGSLSSSAAVTINVIDINDPPTAISSSVTAFRDEKNTIILKGTDPESDNLIMQISSGPANGTLSSINVNNNSVVYTPNPGYTGSDTFTFTARDSQFTSSAATVTITVAERPTPTPIPTQTPTATVTSTATNTPTPVPSPTPILVPDIIVEIDVSIDTNDANREIYRGIVSNASEEFFIKENTISPNNGFLLSFTELFDNGMNYYVLIYHPNTGFLGVDFVRVRKLNDTVETIIQINVIDSRIVTPSPTPSPVTPTATPTPTFTPRPGNNRPVLITIPSLQNLKMIVNLGGLLQLAIQATDSDKDVLMVSYLGNIPKVNSLLNPPGFLLSFIKLDTATVGDKELVITVTDLSDPVSITVNYTVVDPSLFTPTPSQTPTIEPSPTASPTFAPIVDRIVDIDVSDGKGTYEIYDEIPNFLTFSIVLSDISSIQPVNGTIARVIGGGRQYLTYTPPFGFNGTENVTFILSGTSAASEFTVQINVTGTYPTPTATATNVPSPSPIPSPSPTNTPITVPTATPTQTPTPTPTAAVDVDEFVLAQGAGGNNKIQFRNFAANHPTLAKNQIISASSYGSSNAVFRSDVGGGTGRASYFSLGDVDNDGDVDIVDSFGKVTVQDATFPNMFIARDLKTKLPIGSSINAFRPDRYIHGELRTAVGDFKENGTNLIAVAQGFGSTHGLVRLFKYTGLPAPRAWEIVGQFQPLDDAPTARNANGGVTLAAGDVDGDGKDELLAGQTNSETSLTQFTVLDIDSTGSLPERRNFTAFSVGSRGDGGVELCVADLNGDGIKEIVAASKGKRGGDAGSLLNVIRPVVAGNTITGYVRPANALQQVVGDTSGNNPNGGLYIAAGEFDGNTRNGDEIIIGSGEGAPESFYRILKINYAPNEGESGTVTGFTFLFGPPKNLDFVQPAFTGTENPSSGAVYVGAVNVQ